MDEDDDMKRKRTKPYWKMTARELAEATKEFDRPIPASRTRPLTRDERARWERARKQPSRSIYIVDHKIEGGQATVLVRLNSGLLRRARECARRHDMTWEQFLEKSLEGALALLDVPKPSTRRKSA